MYENYEFPVYTKKNVCADCYRCIRSCPVKSIRMIDDAASIIEERCITCGNCVTICPTNAMSIRNDIQNVLNLIKRKKVYVSLAPSWVACFPKISKNQIIHILKNIGFHGVGETALGAEAVSQFIANHISDNIDKQKLYISSCCPSAVDYIRLYMSEYTEYIVNIASPLLTHAKMLKECYGEDIAVVFIGPCVAKKNESDKFKNFIDYAITFEDIYKLLIDKYIDLYNYNENVPEYNFLPHNSNEGTLYAIEGGMNKTLKYYDITKGIRLLSVSGVKNIQNTLEGLNIKNLSKPVFLEALACSHGCIGGPACSKNSSILSIDLIMNYLNARKRQKRIPKLYFPLTYDKSPIKKMQIDNKKLREAMASVGKYSIEDELDCAGCGYNSCYEFSLALMEGYAETSMCVSYMKKIALKKVNAVLKSMPSGVAIIDSNFKIVEVNSSFHNMFKDNISKMLKDDEEAMIGFNILKFLPCKDLFIAGFTTKKDIEKQRYPIENSFYNITIFPIESLLGIIVENVTDNAIKQDEISKKAQEIIQKNIATVQEIASLLGEHVADTEVILNSLKTGDNESINV